MSTGQTSWSYDAHGRVTGVRRDFHGVVLSTAYTYDASGRLVGMTYPSGTQVDYSYSNGQLTGVNVNGQPLMTGITYQPFGAPQSWTWGDGTASTRRYDQDGQLTSLSLAGDTRTLSYDPVGDITAINDSQANRSYGYDALMRLTAANDGSDSWDYAYDANGNRTSLVDASGTTRYGYVAGSNRLASLSGASAKAYRYDANGNIVSDGTHSYQYDARNRLVGVDGRVHYALNGLGQRVEKRTRRGDTLFVYGLSGQLIAKAGPRGRTRREYIYVNGVPAAVMAYRRFGRFFQRAQGARRRAGGRRALPPGLRNTRRPRGRNRARGRLYYIHTDHLGAPRAITNRRGTVVWRWDGEPFGASRPDEDPDHNHRRFRFNLRFPGQYFDRETGLNYSYFRDYDPRTGRYVESDPSGLRGGLNTYGYVGGNPVDFVDWKGKDSAIWTGDIPWDTIGKAAETGITRTMGVFAMCLSLSGDTPQIRHRGRIQAQGNGYEDSESWAQVNPLTLAEGLTKLAALEGRMPTRVYRARAIAIARAASWMVNVSNSGGTGPVSKTFQNPGVKKGERIDVEVITGTAFVP